MLLTTFTLDDLFDLLKFGAEIIQLSTLLIDLSNSLIDFNLIIISA